MLIRHSVSSISPLHTLHDKGFALLHSLNESRISSLIQVILPPLHEYIAQPFYLTDYLDSSFTLSAAPCDQLPALTYEAWEAITDMSIRFFSSQPIKNSLAEYKDIYDWIQYPFKIVEIAHKDLLKLSDKEELKLFSDLFAILMAIFDDARLTNYKDLNHNLDSIGHCDLHHSNFLVANNLILIIDFDNLSLAPAYSDSILFAILGVFNSEGLEKSLSKISKIVGRDVSSKSDALLAFSHALILVNWSHHNNRVRILQNMLRVCEKMKYT